jgi:hypothetical protein
MAMNATNPRPIDEVKLKHQRAILKDLLPRLNKNHETTFEVLCEPDPPDFVLSSEKLKTWVEVTCPLWNPHPDSKANEYARDIFSFAMPDVPHTPMGPGPVSDAHAGMDASFAREVVRVLNQKLTKTSYKEYFESLGPGILILCLFEYPWLDATTMVDIEREWETGKTTDDLGYFGSVFFSYSSLNQRHFHPWQWSNC